jgi:V/A-type H+-transporting ATPase subunit C
MVSEWKYGDDVRYAYALGRIRALETKLITGERLDRMAEASDIDELLRIWGETQYADSLSRMGSPWEYEAVLEDEMRKTMKLMVELSRDPALTSLFQHRYDFHNMKVALKESYGGEPLDSAYIALGTIPVQRLRDAVREEESVGNLLPPLRSALEEVMGAFPETQDPKWIDILLDRATFGTFLEVATREKCPFLHELLQGEIDLINILSLFRIRWVNGEKSFFNEVFLEGGTLSRNFMSSIFEENLDTIPSRFSHTSYVHMVTEGLTGLQTRESFTVFEAMKEEFLLKYIKGADLIAFGIEPLIAYLYKKEREIRTVRTIFVGLLNNVPPEIIKEEISRGSI